MALILITGSDGQLGSELKMAAKSYYGYDFVFTDISTLDLTDIKQTEDFIKSSDPDWIINCAAYNFVDKAEDDSENAMKVNGFAVRNIADAIKGTRCRLIHISSDYVYDGKSNTPYNEESVTDPQSAYGRSKLAGEKYALLHPASMIIRTSWLYSTFGNNFMKTILKKGMENNSLDVVFDQTGTPTYAADLAAAIMQIISGVIRNQVAFNAGIYNFSDEGACTWYDFATEIVREAGLSCHINPVLSAAFPQVAKRPFYSVMDKRKIRENYNLTIPHWRASLEKCISLLDKHNA